jgi:cadmium resistance protein CadD (predicted permease)
VSIAAALAAAAMPEGWIAWSGVVPLGLGVRKLWRLRNDIRETNGETERLRDSEHEAERRTRSQMLAVAAVTIANGGDNLGVYIPVFASHVAAIPIYVAVFAVMTALWCAAGHALVNNRLAGEHVRRFGHRLLPFVLIVLGAWILSGASIGRS